MKRSAVPFRIAGVVGLIALVTLLLVAPVGALAFLNQITPEPWPRPTATAAPYLQLDPIQGVAGAATQVRATGGLWNPGQPVNLYWDSTTLSLGSTTVGPDGTFGMTFTTPTDPAYATVGFHTVLAIQGSLQAEATFELISATPTDTLTPTDTRTPTWTPTLTHTPTPKTPTPTGTSTLTPTPSPTLRPLTPMVTITPIPPTQPPYPARTNTPLPTRTDTPVPGTPTQTLTPSVTPTPSHTPGPGTPSATPLPTATPEEISDTGAGWGTVFLWGFVLAGLLVVFRLLRVRGLPGQS